MTNLLDGATVIKRDRSSLYLAIPDGLLQRVGDGRCGCDYCFKHPGQDAMFDVLVVPMREGGKSSCIHAPQMIAEANTKGVF